MCDVVKPRSELADLVLGSGRSTSQPNEKYHITSVVHVAVAGTDNGILCQLESVYTKQMGLNPPEIGVIWRGVSAYSFGHAFLTWHVFNLFEQTRKERE